MLSEPAHICTREFGGEEYMEFDTFSETEEGARHLSEELIAKNPGRFKNVNQPFRRIISVRLDEIGTVYDFPYEVNPPVLP